MAVNKVPNYIKNKMHRIASLHQQASKLMDEIEQWLDKNGIDPGVGGMRDGCGTSLEEFEYGNDVTDALCERIENFDTWVPPDVSAKEN